VNIHETSNTAHSGRAQHDEYIPYNPSDPLHSDDFLTMWEKHNFKAVETPIE
jgi:hypothetical protein